MRILRYSKSGESEVRHGWLDGDRIGSFEGSPLGSYRRGGIVNELAAVTLHPPCQPGKIVGVGRNYPSGHEAGEEREAGVADLPILFLKPPTALIATGAAILLPPQSARVEHEAELAVVIGKRAHRLAPEDALGCVLGYTIANDVTARDLQRRDTQWTRSKGFDTFCPLGPWIVTDLDPTDLMIACSVNGQMRQMGSTIEMRFSAKQLIAYISSVMTLEPGDVILTGTPTGSGPLVDGDTVEVEVEGIGRLRNPVRDAPGVLA